MCLSLLPLRDGGVLPGADTSRRREPPHVNRVESLTELIQRERLLQWTAVAAVALLWFAVAWTDPLPLLALAPLIGGVYLYRRRRGPVETDDELEYL